MEVVTGALPSLLPKLADLLVGEYNLQKEVKRGIRFLQTELETMKAALEEMSETPADKLNRVDKIWARDVKELSYDIEDSIDTFIVRCKGSRLAEQHGLIRRIIGRSLDWLIQPKIRRNIATDIKDIKSRVEEVSRRRDRYKVYGEAVRPVLVDSRLLARYEKTSDLVGIDDARDELIKMMLMGDSQQEKVVSIVGFGGLGKTTLANVVYENLRGSFDCSAFVAVSQTPNMEILFNNLLYQLDKRDKASLNNVIDDLREFLHRKRYFIVIDDIWDISVWKIIRYALPDHNRGCKIIITTRILNVAEEIGCVYKMKPLCLHSSRILFYRRIFGSNDRCPDEELAIVSDRILIKCAGVPLAIITIASLLASKGRNKSDWYEVYNSIGTGMEDNTDVTNMRKVLLLSYYNLPPHLKTCLLYLSVFPEDYEIGKNRLIWMWIAEGFICGKQGYSQFEVGESYFNELINRSMIQPKYGIHDTRILSFRVHDMVLDLINALSSEENFITQLNDLSHTSRSQKVRRLCLTNGNGGTHGATVNMQQVRSVIAFSTNANQIPSLSRFKVLRVLCLENFDLSHGYNLNYTGKLVHLRCLGLRSTNIIQLPDEIGNLQFLQMLDISNNEIPTLPSTIVQLRQLKCLYIDKVNTTMSNRIGALTSLEELSGICIGNSLTMEELGNLIELRVLDMVYFGERDQYMLVECLSKLQNIKNLSISFNAERGDLLDGWVGPQSLHSLRLDGYCFFKLPFWISHLHVQNLSFLEISLEELQQEDLEILGRLPTLRDLNMSLADIKPWEVFFDETHIKPWEVTYSPVEDSLLNYRSIFNRREFVFSAGLFLCLVQCKLWGHYNRVVFRQGATPRLTRLQLDISRVVWSSWTEIPDLGFENLSSLLDLHVNLSGGDPGNLCEERASAALRNMAEIHPNHPSISVGWW